MDHSLNFDILLIQDLNTRGFTALLLQHDIAGQGDTPQEAIDVLVSTIAAEIAYHQQCGKRPLEMIARTPQRYWDMRDNGIPLPIPCSLDRPRLTDALKEDTQCESVSLAM